MVGIKEEPRLPGDSTRTMVELHIPSILGYEKVAMDTASSLARDMGFSVDRVADLRMAVGEACLNAIEHGNQLDASVKVGVTLTVDPHALQVDVHDSGSRFERALKDPNIDEKMSGESDSRGWGMFLIQKLVDEVSFDQAPEGGNRTRLIVHLKQQDTQ
jgi:serine/threonine-protein kinase RsbW